MKNKRLSFAIFLVIALILNAPVNAQRIINNKPLRTKSNKATIQWIEMGPSNMGGRTRAILIDKNNPNLIYASAISGGLWKSTTGGSSWTLVANTDNSIFYITTTSAIFTGYTHSFLWQI